MKINLSPLEKTIRSLESSLLVYDKYENTEDKELKVSLKESVIKSFEMCYEMSRSLMDRYLKEYTDEKVDQMTIHDIFRHGEKNGILSSAEIWFDYRKKRNQTSHVYDINIAEEVFLTARNFLEDVRFLFKKLEEKIES